MSAQRRIPLPRVAAERVRVTDSIARVRRDSIVSDSLQRLAAGGAAVDSFPVYTPANPARLGSRRRLCRAPVEVQHEVRCDPRSQWSVRAASRSDLRYRVPVAFLSEPRRRVRDPCLLPSRCSRNCARGARSRRASAASITFRSPSSWIPSSPRARSPARIARYAARGLPVYGLRQPNGGVRLYYGAYSTPEQAALAVPALRDAGIRPLLVYRIGRVF